MKHIKITKNELLNIGYPNNPRLQAVAIHAMLQHYQKAGKSKVMLLLKDILINPLVYRNDKILGKLSRMLTQIKP